LKKFYLLRVTFFLLWIFLLNNAEAASVPESSSNITQQPVTISDIPYKKVENESSLVRKSYMTLFILVAVMLGVLWFFNKKINKGIGLFPKNTNKLNLKEQGKFAGNKQYYILDFEGRTILVIESKSGLSTLELSKNF